MFTGIIEELGTVRRLTRTPARCVLEIEAQTVLEGTKLGDSIAVNGVCLTVTALDASSFTADMMPETLRRSNLGDLKPGDAVNLERALPVNGRLGGHFVAGHIDGTGKLIAKTSEGNATVLTVQVAPSLLRYIVEKGSVAIDGVSLTVVQVTHTDFTVSLIPHTGTVTTLLQHRPGDLLNIETDLLGKYVEKLLQPQDKPLTKEILRENGFM